MRPAISTLPVWLAALFGGAAVLAVAGAAVGRHDPAGEEDATDAGTGHEQGNSRYQRGKGEGAPMTDNTSRDTAVPDEPQALAEDIEQTPEQLGQAVEAPAVKTDVKAQVCDKARQVSSGLRGATLRAGSQAKEYGKSLGGQVSAKTPAVRQALPVVVVGSVTGSLAGAVTYLAVRKWGQR